MELAGSWRAVEADEELRRAYPAPDFDDRGWEEITVPGHWQSSSAFAESNGPLLHRHRFEVERPAEGRRSWLTFEGLFYQGDVWLDGSYVGDTEGYFFPHTFEVTDALRSRTEHVLALELTCSPQRDKTAKRNITGVFQHWDCLDPDWNPGGIWRPVRLGETGPVRIARLRALCAEATPERAVVRFRAVLDAAEPAANVCIRTTIGATDHEHEQPLAAGENRVVWTVVVDNPALWWPHALGDQPLHQVNVEVRLPDRSAEPSDRRTFTTGLRQVRMKNWVTSVNGERLFLKGSNQGPTRMRLAEATAEELERDVVLAKDAGLDMLRVHGHVSRPELYDAADHHGLLLWQDMPLQWGYARGIRKQAMRQAREAVDLLGHHPSIAIWCGHNEPMALDVEPGTKVDAARLRLRYLALQQVPTWNKTILDSSVKRALDKADGTRPTVAHSGVMPHVGADGTDAHLYFGWYHGDERDLAGYLAAWPRQARFVSEFGAQAVPENAEFMGIEGWPALDWRRLARTHALQVGLFKRHGLDPADFATFDEWRQATQAYQATVVRHHVEHLRRLKYRPTGGFCQFAFADGHPAVTWSVLDHERAPKLGYEALAAACAPVIVTADRPAAAYAPGDALALDVHVVSDLRAPVADAKVTATLRWEGGSASWSWQGDVPADGCQRVGMVRALVPDAVGPLVLDLHLDAPDVKAANRYESTITST